jgi:predicted GTPase
MVVEVDVRRMLNGLNDWLTEVSASDPGGASRLDHPVRETLVLAVNKLDEYNQVVDDLRLAMDEIIHTSASNTEHVGISTVNSLLLAHGERCSLAAAQWRNVDDVRSG